MLMGEHAVLHGKQALACAVNKRITVRKQIRSDDTVIIHSSLGTYQSNRKALQPDPRFTFVLACLQDAPSGLELTIESEFSHEVGLGSSAAVCVATLGSLYGPTITPQELFDKSIAIVRQVQQVASGADVAASVFGGIVLYRMSPCQIIPLAKTIPLTLIYSGSKMKTKDVIERVLKSKNKHPALFSAIFDAMDMATLEAKEAILHGDYETLGRLLSLHHGLQDAIGTCNLHLAEIVHALQNSPGIYGAKISGSGLGDCAIGLGSAVLDIKYQQIPVQVSQQGVLFL